MSIERLLGIPISFEAVSVPPKLRKHRRKDSGHVCRRFDNLSYRRTHYVHNDQGLRFCWLWTTKRNREGYFVGCREVFDPESGMGFRDSWMQRKARWRVKNWCLKQFNASPYRKQRWTYPVK